MSSKEGIFAVAQHARELGLWVEEDGWTERGCQGFNASGTPFGTWTIRHLVSVTVWCDSPQEADIAKQLILAECGVRGVLVSHSTAAGTLDGVYYR